MSLADVSFDMHDFRWTQQEVALHKVQKLLIE